MNAKLQEMSVKIAPIMREYGIKRASIFGSYARGEEKRDSDIDLLIHAPRGFSLFDLFEMRDKLSDIFKKDIDIVSEKYIHKALEGYINKDKKLIYEER